ncbi:hypothetical protein ACLQ24_23210 [Micromonospora sp. DT4]|uniref:hypothetical protein n=1 Tax=Micromonospora sp. DT4 TaxID=3393438 RepID=UPI003CF3AE17
MWLIRRSDGTAEGMGATLTPLILTKAAERARATNDSTHRTVSQLLLAPDRATKLDLLTNHREQLTSPQARADLARIVRQVDDDPWFRSFTPLLGDLGAQGKAEFVLDFQEIQEPADRNRLLIDAPGREITIDQRVDLITDSGHQTAGAATIMKAVDLMLTQNLDTALTYIEERSATLRNEEKRHWVDALSKLARQHTDPHHDQFRGLAEMVLDCTDSP